MDKELLEEIIKEINFNEEINFNDIPSIDLYMDQVITLFDRGLGSSKRNEKDKILTKTMINNYAKDKLLMSIKNKKYTREHIVLMILIYNLKQSLAIADIKQTLTPLVSKLENEETIDIRLIYDTFLNMKNNDIQRVKADIDFKLEHIEEQLSNIEGDNKEYIKLLLTVLSLINTANMYKRITESIIDKFLNNDNSY